MRSTAAQAQDVPNGCLVEQPALAPLLRTQAMMMGCVISTDGPHEWMECVDAHGLACARMHLLPDTDYLAWDALIGCGQRMADFQVFAPRLEPSPDSAQMLRFRSYWLAGLRVLGADVACTPSRLSLDLAGRIARDEALSLQPSDRQ